MKFSNLFKRKPKTAAVGRVSAASTNPDNPDEANQWRRWGMASPRNLPSHDHRRMVKGSIRSAQVDGLARTHARLVRAVTVGAQEVGVVVEATDASVRERLQAFADQVWNHPANDFSTGLGDMMDDLTNTGGICLTAIVDMDEQGVGSRLTIFGNVDAEAISEVVKDPANTRTPVAVLRDGWLAV